MSIGRALLSWVSGSCDHTGLACLEQITWWLWTSYSEDAITFLMKSENRTNTWCYDKSRTHQRRCLLQDYDCLYIFAYLIRVTLTDNHKQHRSGMLVLVPSYLMFPSKSSWVSVSLRMRSTSESSSLSPAHDIVHIQKSRDIMLALISIMLHTQDNTSDVLNVCVTQIVSYFLSELVLRLPSETIYKHKVSPRHVRTCLTSAAVMKPCPSLSNVLKPSIKSANVPA